MNKYTVFFEQTATGYSAHVPDLPGCVGAAATLEEARELSKLADELKLALEKNDRYVLSIGTLKKTEEIERLAKRIRDRLKH